MCNSNTVITEKGIFNNITNNK